MREKQLYLLIGCAIGLAAAIGGMILKSCFTPVGDLNGERIYSFQIQSYAAVMRNNAVTSYAKDQVFFKAMDELGITVSDQAVEDEYQKCAKQNGGGNESAEDKTSIKKAILQQKAISYFAEKSSPSEEDIQSYFEKHLTDFPKGLKQEKEAVGNAVKAEQGEKAYNRYMEQAEQCAVIKVY